MATMSRYPTKPVEKKRTLGRRLAESAFSRASSAPKVARSRAARKSARTRRS